MADQTWLGPYRRLIFQIRDTSIEKHLNRTHLIGMIWTYKLLKHMMQAFMGPYEWLNLPKATQDLTVSELLRKTEIHMITYSVQNRFKIREKGCKGYNFMKVPQSIGVEVWKKVLMKIADIGCPGIKQDRPS